MQPVSTCRAASSYKISLKSDNRSMNYGKKPIINMAAAAILNFKNFTVTWLGSLSAVVYQILSKSDDFSLKYGDLAIFKMAAVRHLGFLWRYNTASPDTFSLSEYYPEISSRSVM